MQKLKTNFSAKFNKSCIRKDFRQFVLSAQTLQPTMQNIAWKSDLIASNSSMTYRQPILIRHAVNRSEFSNGYAGFFLQASLKLKKNALVMVQKEEDFFVLSTETNIIPEYSPIGDCDGFECLGRLVWIKWAKQTFIL